MEAIRSEALVKQSFLSSIALNSSLATTFDNRISSSASTVASEELLKQLAEAKLVTEEKRKVLQQCMKKTTALEKMKEIQFEEYKAALSMEEKQQLENLASIKTFADYTVK